MLIWSINLFSPWHYLLTSPWNTFGSNCFVLICLRQCNHEDVDYFPFTCHSSEANVCVSDFIVSSVPHIYKYKYSIYSSFAGILCGCVCCLCTMPLRQAASQHHRGDYCNFPPSSLCLHSPALSGWKLQLEHNDVMWLLMPHSFLEPGLPAVCLRWPETFSIFLS